MSAILPPQVHLVGEKNWSLVDRKDKALVLIPIALITIGTVTLVIGLYLPTYLDTVASSVCIGGGGLIDIVGIASIVWIAKHFVAKYKDSARHALHKKLTRWVTNSPSPTELGIVSPLTLNEKTQQLNPSRYQPGDLDSFSCHDAIEFYTKNTSMGTDSVRDQLVVSLPWSSFYNSMFLLPETSVQPRQSCLGIVTFDGDKQQAALLEFPPEWTVDTATTHQIEKQNDIVVIHFALKKFKATEPSTLVEESSSSVQSSSSFTSSSSEKELSESSKEDIETEKQVHLTPEQKVIRGLRAMQQSKADSTEIKRASLNQVETENQSKNAFRTFLQNSPPKGSPKTQGGTVKKLYNRFKTPEKKE